MKAVVFYHNDNDGKAAARWIYKRRIELGYDDIVMLSVDYGNIISFGEIDNADVWVVDFSFEPEDMRMVRGRASHVYWIDHHKTAIDKYKDFEVEIDGIRRDGVAGCLLTWAFVEGLIYWRGNTQGVVLEYNEAPFYLRLIADRDVWKFEYGDKTRWFHLATQTMDLGPMSDDWEWIEAEEFRGQVKHVNIGNTIEKYRDRTAKEYRDAYGYEFEWEGYRCFAMNLGHEGAEHFGEKNQEYDLLIAYVFDGEQWRVSLSTERDIDVSVIAVKHGGGGHRSACGFRCKELPWVAKTNGCTWDQMMKGSQDEEH